MGTIERRGVNGKDTPQTVEGTLWRLHPKHPVEEIGDWRERKYTVS